MRLAETAAAANNSQDRMTAMANNECPGSGWRWSSVRTPEAPATPYIYLRLLRIVFPPPALRQNRAGRATAVNVSLSPFFSRSSSRLRGNPCCRKIQQHQKALFWRRVGFDRRGRQGPERHDGRDGGGIAEWSCCSQTGLLDFDVLDVFICCLWGEVRSWSRSPMTSRSCAPDRCS